ncbi:hypothetical protein F5Y02DRAFT_430714 [Annulohypoxylon stygium]|nr:hypothetical protein F5Y02DRAFT_430714 [Annulohypoxylon stygium]
MLSSKKECWATALVNTRGEYSSETAQSRDLGPILIPLTWLLTAISTLIIAVRFYVRLTFRGKLNLDDYIIIITWIFNIMNSVFLTIASYLGLGKHYMEIPPSNVVFYGKWIYLSQGPAILSPGFGRISFAFLLLSLTPPSKARRKLLWGVICTQFIADVGTIIIIYTQCRPVQGLWDESIERDCWPRNAQIYTGYFQGSICALSDLVLALFPISLFWNLRMHWRQKAFLSGIMGLGIFAMVAAIFKTVNLRLVYINEDVSYHMAIVAIWWTVEGNFVLIAVSIPTIKPILNAPRSMERIQRNHANYINTFLSRKRAAEDKSTEGRRHLERLQESPPITEGGDEESQQELSRNTYQLDCLGESSNRDGSIGIRREITVSVTFNEDLRPSYIKPHLDQSRSEF